MIVFFYLILFTCGTWSAPTELEDCAYCQRKAARCEEGHVVENSCVRCECTAERLYQCTPVEPACGHVSKENMKLGKPTEARCYPRMIYVLGSVTCMCSKTGHWPHDKCEVTFMSLHKPDHTKLANDLQANEDIQSHSDIAKIKKMVAANYNISEADIQKIVITNYDPSNRDHAKLLSNISKKKGQTKDKQRESKLDALAEGIDAGTSCEPDSYFIHGCNVCKCNAQGSVERCTQNDCSESEQTKRSVVRRNNNVQGSCIPNNWYALAPCQFCYCQQSNKLICSTHFQDYSHQLSLGAYNLTDCGRDLIKELYELGPDINNNGTSKTLREGAVPVDATSAAPPVSPAPPVQLVTARQDSRSTSTIKHSSVPYDPNEVQVSLHLKKVNELDKVEYESETEEEVATEALRVAPEPNTLSPFENEEESGEEEVASSNTYVRLPDGSYKPVANQQESGMNIPSGGSAASAVTAASAQPSILNAMMTAQGMPKEMAQILASMPEVSQMHSPLLEPAVKEVHNYDVSIQPSKPDAKPDAHVLRINLPSVVERIIKLALRKSMVRIDATQNCMPGTTSQDGCNFCYCLTNGKLLCTDKKTC